MVTRTLLTLLAFIALCMSLITAPVMASVSTADIRQTLEQGDYRAAAERGEALGTAAGYIVAAEALSAQVLVAQARKPKKQAKQAMKLAQKAIALEPDNLDAHIQYALAYGFMTRETGDTKAWATKLPHKCRKVIDAVRARAPNDARGMALKASWHVGILLKDSNYANGLYGADEAKAMLLYAQAHRLMPEDWVINANYLFSAAAMGPRTYAAEIETLMTQLLAKPAVNAVEQVYQARVRELSNIMADPIAAQRRAQDWLQGKP